MPAKTEKRIALVTGASRGIGRATALRLAGNDRHVVCAARNVEPLHELVEQIQQQGGSAAALSCDVSVAGNAAAMVEQVIEQWGRLDILVNNAGVTRDNLLLRMSDEEFDTVLQMNLRSVFETCRAAMRPMMRGRWGRVVNVGSVAGLVGNIGQSNYAAAKAGLVGFTRSLAKEMASKGITANVVAPGFIETDMTASLSQAIKSGVLKVTPAGRFGTAEEIAAAIGYLASDEAGYVTGQVLTVDGGMTMC